VGLATVALTLTGAVPTASAAPFAYIGYQAATGDGIVAVVDASNFNVIASVPIGAPPSGVAVNAAGTKAWVASSGTGATTVTLVETTLSGGQPTSVRVAAVVNLLRDRPTAIALSPNGGTAYVTHADGWISVVDTTSYAVTGFAAAVGSMLRGIAVNPAGTRLFVSDATQRSVLVVDPALQSLVGAPLAVGFTPEGIAVNPVGTQVYAVGAATNGVGWVSLIDANALTWTNLNLGSGVNPAGVAVHPAGHHVYVTNRSTASVSIVYAPTRTVMTPTLTSQIRVGRSPNGIAIDATGQRVFVLGEAASTAATPGILSVIDPQAMTGYGLPGIPVTFGMFVGGGAADSNTAKLQEELDAANATIARLTTELANAEALKTQLDAANAKIDALTAELAAANSKVTALQSEVDDLKKQLASVADLQAELTKAKEAAKQLTDDLEAANLTIASFVRRLVAGRTDANVAEAVRVAAERQIALATSKLGWKDPRVRHAQKEYGRGMAALRDGHFQRAVKEFVDAYESASRLRRS
jgi:YVTN family beta-propeller protein